MQGLLSLFADDTKLYSTIRNKSDQLAMQESLDALSKWTVDWKMQFNVSKCAVMHIGHNNPRTEYMLAGEKIKTTQMEKDVGVIIQDNLKFDQHCRKIATTCNRIIGQIRRSFTNKSPELMVMLFKTYILPHVDYCASLWNPGCKRDIAVIESIQRRFTRIISGLEKLSYEERLAALDLPKLQERRRRQDLVQAWKIWNDIDKVDGKMFTRVSDHHNISTRHSLGDNFVVNKTRLNIRKNFFSNRIVNDWNLLPDHVQQAKGSVKAFKTKLDKVIL